MLYVVFGWDTKGLVKLKKRFKKRRTIPTKIIVFFAHEFSYSDAMFGEHQGFNKLLNLANLYNISVVLILGSSDKKTKLSDFSYPLYRNLKIIHWSNFWIHLTYFNHEKVCDINRKKSKLDIYDENTLQSNNSYDYKYIFLNNRPHYHRCLLIDIMAKYNLITQGAVSWHETGYNEEMSTGLVSVNRGFKYKYWTPEILTLDPEYRSTYEQNILPKEYSKSWVQLVSESTTEDFFITEKTSVPLFYMKPFLVASCVNFHAELKDMGFQMYDEIFDYSFDSIDDIKKRFNLIALNIKKVTELSDSDIKNLNTAVLPKLKANRNRAIELATKLNNQPSILKDINDYSSDDSYLLNFKEYYNKLI